jgi:hypothetical protein
MSAFDEFWRLDMCSFYMVNDSILTLIPKSSNAAALKEYRPISLIHLVGRLFSKVLSNSLAPRLGSLIHSMQSAFIRAGLSRIIFGMCNIRLNFSTFAINQASC